MDRAENSNSQIASSLWRPLPWGLVWILVAGAFARGVLILAWGSDQGVSILDEMDYNQLAIHLVEDGEFAINEHVICSSRPPLYPGMLAGVYTLVGKENFFAVRVLQAGLGLLLTMEVYCFAGRLFDRRTGLLAAALTTFYPTLVGFTLLLLSEILFSVLLMGALLLFQSHRLHASWIKLMLAGVLFGLATLTRSVLWPFLPLLGLYVLASERGGWVRRFASAAVTTFSFALTLTPWAYRNLELERTLIVVDTLGGRNLMMGNYEHTLEYRSWDTVTISGAKAWDHVLLAETPNYNDLTQGERDKLAMRRGLRYIADHPGVFLRRSLIKFFNFWQLPRTIVAAMADGRWGTFSRLSVWTVAAILFASYAVTLLTGVCGFLLLPADDRWMHWFLLLLVGFVCAVHTVVFAHSRYHLSLMPLMFVYSAQAMLHWREIWNRRGSKAGWLAAGVCVLLAGSWVWQMAFVEGERIRQWIGGA